MALFTLTALPAQEWVFVDGPAYAGSMTAFDQVRERLVALGPDGATWELADGELLHRQVFGASPPPRSRGALVYDRAREHVLLFGGRDATGAVLADTWSWDGLRWTQLVGGPQPTARADAAIGYDMVRQRVVMSGGQLFPGLVADTWEHDGTQWLQRTPATTPGLNSATMAYDLARFRMVMVVPSGLAGAPVSTWEWDGVDWAQRSTSGPPANGNEGMAYDPVRQRVVMFGGVGLEEVIWEWDGTTWQSIPVPGAPWRLDPAVWFDTTTNKIAIFGGADFHMWGFQVARGSDRTDAFTWDGTSFSSTHDDLRPGSRYGHALCEQPGGGVVLFGGTYKQAAGDDTWVWNGNSWQARSPAHVPPARSGGGAVFDATRQETLLFGGSNSGFFRADLWAWDGQDWTLRHNGFPAPGVPLGRIEPALSHDLVRGVTVLFGGFVGAQGHPTVPGNDTMEWNGSAWIERMPATKPSPRAGSALAYDPVHQRTVLFGGRNGATAQHQLDDTWSWDGTDWQPLQLPVSPPALLQPSMHFDPASGGLLLVGSMVTTTPFSTQVWLLANGTWTQLSVHQNYQHGGPTAWDSNRQRLVGFKVNVLNEWTTTPASATTYGSGCGAPAPELTVRSRARLGEQAFGLETAGGGHLPAIFALALESGNAPFGGGCAVLVAAPILATTTMTGASGRAEVTFPLPAETWLRGVTLYAQAAVLDPAAPLGLGLTPGLMIVLGD